MVDYLLIGEKLSHSHSPLVHSLLGDYRYELAEVAQADLDHFIRSHPFKGANVTIPYKIRAHALCDHLSEEAELLGNVNTLVVGEDGNITGYNTDLYGMIFLIASSGIEVKGRKVAVLGSGGAAQTTTVALRMLEAEDIIMISRSGPIDYKALYNLYSDVQVIINATPVGMFPRIDASPVDLDRLPEVGAVIDLIYNPHRTKLLIDAKARRLQYANGLAMLVAQAAEAKALFTGIETETEDIISVIQQVRMQLVNLVIVGMPGSGKSTIGKKLSKQLDRELVDIDSEIVKKTHLSIPDIFEKCGEPFFRDVESEMIEEVVKRKGIIIATGGGAVLRQRNVELLQRDGVVIHLVRKNSELSTNGRPLSQDLDRLALARLEIERMPHYLGAMDYQTKNEGSLASVVEQAKEGFYAVTRH